MAARTRETNRWDAVINGVNYRLARKEGAYRKVSGRSMLEIQQMLNQAGNQFTSTRDLRTLFQTDWSGGAQWQKPLLSDQSIDTYFQSDGFDIVTEPGNVFPTPDVGIDTSTFGFNSGFNMLQVTPEQIYFWDDNGGSGNKRIGKWNGSTYTYLTNRPPTTSGGSVMIWDNANATIYLLGAGGGGSSIFYVTPDTASGSVAGITGAGTPGANIFMHFGTLMHYNGSKLATIDDPLGTPVVTTVYDDQMGGDIIGTMIDGTSSNWTIAIYDTRLAISTNEGVWIVKNVAQNGSVTALITRVDRTNDGTYVGVPIATLPPGYLALDVSYHLGSLLISATSDLALAAANDSDEGFPVATIFHVTNDSLGTIGEVLGGLAPTDSVHRFIGADHRGVYLGGTTGIWLYDPVRGGFHKWMDEDSTDYPFMSSATSTDASGNYVQMFTKYLNSDKVWLRYLKDEGGSTDTHTLESNYIDGNLPSELKSLVGITLMTSGIKTGETWTVTIEADDAASFASAATFTTVGSKTSYKALVAPITGYRFRYKLAWTATGDITAPSRVKGIVLHMVQGEMEVAWQLTLDLSEVRSIEGTVLRPETAQANLETLMAKQTLTTYVDEFRVTSSTHDVRVDSVQVSKDASMEGEATVVLSEQDLNN